jgi:biotin operon repressor
MDFIEANQGKMSGAEIAKTLGRSKSSVNKWIAEKVV